MNRINSLNLGDVPIFCAQQENASSLRESSEFYVFYLSVTEEIATYICCWETLAELPLVIDQLHTKYHWPNTNGSCWTDWRKKLNIENHVKFQSQQTVTEMVSKMKQYLPTRHHSSLRSTREKTEHLYHSWKINRSFPKTHVRSY